MKGTLHEDRCTFFIISRSVLLRVREFRIEVVEKIKTHVLCPTTFSRKSGVTVSLNEIRFL